MPLPTTSQHSRTLLHQRTARLRLAKHFSFLPTLPLPAVAQAPARQVGPTFFSDRSMYISKDQAKQLQKALQKIKVLDKNGWVRYDTRVVSGGWAGLLGGAGRGGRCH